MPGHTMGSLSSSFTKLQRLSQSFGAISSLGERQQSALLDLAMELGATAIPLCIRELGSDDLDPSGASRELSQQASDSVLTRAPSRPGHTRLGWACILLLALAADDGLRPRVVSALQALARGSASRAATRARNVLAELHDDPGTPPGVADHPALAEGSGALPGAPAENVDAELVEQLRALPRRAPDIAHAGHLLATQLEPQDMFAVLEQLASCDPARALDLLDELHLRNDLDEGERAYVRRLRVEVCALSGLPAAGAARSIPPGGQRVATAYIGSHPSGRCLVLATCRSASSMHHRAIYLLITPDDIIVDGLYREDAGPCDVETEILGPVRAQGHRVATHGVLHIRELVLRAAHHSRELGSFLPPAFYLGRDLLGIHGEHTDPAYSWSSPPGAWVAGHPGASDLATTELGLLLDRALALLDGGRPERARPLLERLLVGSPDSVDGNAALARCLMALGETRAARGYARTAAQLDPTEARHPWTLAAIAHIEERPGSCYLALLDYLDLAGDRDGATGSTAQRHRSARRFVAEYERIARLEYPEVDPEAVARADDLVHIAREHLQDGHASKAIVGLQQALATVPEHYLAATWLGIAHRENGQRNRAIECLRRALARRPGYPDALQALDALIRQP